MNDKIFLIIAGSILIGTAIARTLKNTYDKTIRGRLGIFSTFFVSLVGGILLGLLVSIYTDEQKWQWIAASIGSWGGERTLEIITDFIHDKFLNTKKDEK